MAACVAPVTAQVDVATATLKGIVTDQNGAAVAGATVTAMSTARGFKKAATTATDGTYQISLLQPGGYDVQVEAQGFGKAIAKEVQLTVGQSLVYDVSLTVGALTSIIDITTEAPLIQVEQTQQANTINSLQV
ncbi:MAG TPA: carboxypeptidase-like regulatory domain-containing protein, partial [Pyrinomonadaceae bacterium]|nr:carboxypeptidase-like regulatory domain-containing protein [Pyrinomonadaceae bacterium]